MQGTQKYKHYDDLSELLKISPQEIDTPIYYKGNLKRPIWFAIEYARRDIIVSLLKKQTPQNKIELINARLFTYTYAMDALKEHDVGKFIIRLKSLILIDESKETSTKLAKELDAYLASLPRKEFKIAIQALLKSLPHISAEYVEVFSQSKYLNYLATAFNGNTQKAAKEFNPEHLHILNKAGFNRAQAKKNKNGDACARCFIKQVLQEKTDGKQPVLFYQDLFLDNLDYAVGLINNKKHTKLKVDKGGACAGFTKYWLFHELGLIDAQNKFFREIMAIASLTQEEIRKKIEDEFAENKGDEDHFHESFIKLVMDYANRFDTVHANDQFQGQLSQRTMKKNFGLEFVDEFDVKNLKPDKPISAYLRIRYTNGGTGHAIGIRIQQKKLPSGETFIEYKVWDPNSKPKKLNQAEFIAYLNTLKSDPKIKTLSIYEFSPYAEATTKDKISAIEQFRASISKLKNPNLGNQGPLLSCIELLLQHYDTGVVPLNQVIPLFVVLGKILNSELVKSGQNIDLTALYAVIDQQGLIKPETLDITKLPFLHEFVDSALDMKPPLLYIVTALFSLGLSEDHYYRQSHVTQDRLLELAHMEGRMPFVNSILRRRLNNPDNFPVAIAIGEMVSHPTNLECKHILASLLLKGKTLTNDDFDIFDKKPKTSSLFGDAPPYRKTIRAIILEQLSVEMAKNAGKSLGEQDQALLTMLDNALNPIHAKHNSCYDILTLKGMFSDKKVEPRKQILEALKKNNITIHSSMEKKYPFLFQAMEHAKVATLEA